MPGGSPSKPRWQPPNLARGSPSDGRRDGCRIADRETDGRAPGWGMMAACQDVLWSSCVLHLAQHMHAYFGTARQDDGARRLTYNPASGSGQDTGKEDEKRSTPRDGWWTSPRQVVTGQRRRKEACRRFVTESTSRRWIRGGRGSRSDESSQPTVVDEVHTVSGMMLHDKSHPKS